MKIFCTFPTVNISKLNFLLVICISKNFIWTILKAIFSICWVFVPSDPRFSNNCISAKYCPILSNHTPMQSLFINLKYENCTLMTGFVVQGHVLEFCTNLQEEKFTWRHILCANSPLWGFGSGDFSLGTSGSIKQYFFPCDYCVIIQREGKRNTLQFYWQPYLSLQELV